MNHALALPAAVVAVLLMPLTASADGRLPPRPYHFLHPLRTLAQINGRPSSGQSTVPVVRGKSSKEFFVFTQDGQDGVQAPSGALTTAVTVRRIAIRVVPINSPAGLPRHLIADGNAYNISALALPTHRSVSVAHRVQLFVRWPHLPSELYEYRNHRWSSVCTAAHWSLSFPLVSCPVSTLGIFLAVSPAKL